MSEAPASGLSAEDFLRVFDWRHVRFEGCSAKLTQLVHRPTGGAAGTFFEPLSFTEFCAVSEALAGEIAEWNDPAPGPDKIERLRGRFAEICRGAGFVAAALRDDGGMRLGDAWRGTGTATLFGLLGEPAE